MNIVLRMDRVLSFICISMVLGAASGFLTARPAFAMDVTKTPIVVELFTSQGCSSCPPADEILAELSQQKNILALSYSVDYWNYLGWKDTLAQPDCTLRQKKYNKSLGLGGVYTPQMIIQGRRDVIGSRADLVDKFIDQAKITVQATSAPEITFVRRADMMFLNISANVMWDNAAATIWIIGYDFEKTVSIKKGELAGQIRKYHNVVQSIKRLGSWMGEETRLSLSKEDVGSGKYDAYAVLLQAQETGPIITAAELK
ncbi:hypothetical protein that often co-occurs with aconitase [hydrothermal vent metagenome]|uniref:DUF1223 domain-containing protein n=1 Tax=hydrothermal vent metagenome TaxID=652676 RepID=A0A3B1B9G0_9ZZZZ